MGEARSIEVLVSDVGQVLLPFDTSRVWERLLGATSLPEAEFRALLHELYHALDIDRRAEVGREFHAELVRRGGLRLRFEEFAWAWSDMFWEDAETIALIAGAPVRQRWLLSNTNGSTGNSSYGDSPTWWRASTAGSPRTNAADASPIPKSSVS